MSKLLIYFFKDSKGFVIFEEILFYTTYLSRIKKMLIHKWNMEISDMGY